MVLDGHRPHAFDGVGTLKCKFKSIPLLPQSYTIRMAIRAKDGKNLILDYQDVASFNVVGNLERYGYRGEDPAVASRTVSVVVPHEWILPDGTVVAVDLSLP
jgi:lipopolysaccharide transport system ATP-binding protein